MILTDVNVLVQAFRKDLPEHELYRDWLELLINGLEVYAQSDLVLSGFLRVVTHPRAFRTPSTIEEAMEFATAVRDHPNCVVVAPAERHWAIFQELCRRAKARGNLVPDAYLAALAIESGCEWVTSDRDYARFPGLRWRHPFD